MTNFATVIYWENELIIEYDNEPINHQDAWKPCGDGTWVYDIKDNKIGRVNIGFSHELPYHFSPETWNPNKRFYKVLASSEPLRVWWCNSEKNDNLTFESINCALPKIKTIEKI